MSDTTTKPRRKPAPKQETATDGQIAAMNLALTASALHFTLDHWDAFMLDTGMTGEYNGFDLKEWFEKSLVEPMTLIGMMAMMFTEDDK